MPIRRHQAPISLRLRFHDDARIGPGKIALLEAIRTTGSVNEAGKMMDMSARRAWLLLESLNNAFDEPLVALQHPGSPDESEASLTALGEEVSAAYRDVEARTLESVHQRFEHILTHLRQAPDFTD